MSIKTIQFVFISLQMTWTNFYMIQVFTERYFRIDCIAAFHTRETGNWLLGQNLEEAIFVYILKQEIDYDS